MILSVTIIIVAVVSTVVALSWSCKNKARHKSHERLEESGQCESTKDINDVPGEIGSEDKDASAESSRKSVLEEYNDSKQDLLDFVAAMSDTSSYKNRYSALQNTSYVTQLLTREYEASSKEVGFYDFVLSFCEKMKFQNGDDAYIIAESVATKLKSRESHPITVKAPPSKATTKTRRLSPESIYPFTKTGDEDVDEFIDIAKELLHKRVRHLKTSEKENEEEVSRVVRSYRPHSGRSFYDFFANQFQFGYLTEKRFQELYYLLFQIAQAKKDGLSKAEVIQRINSIYHSDNSEKSQAPKRIIDTERKTSVKKTVEATPFNAYTQIQHRIISIASRISRTYYENIIFRRTGSFAIALINKFHEVPKDTISERTFYTINLSGLQKEDKKNAPAYAILIDVVNFVFEGMSEDDVIHHITLDKRMPPLPQNQTQIVESKPPKKRTEVRSSCLIGRAALLKTIKECGMAARTQECINLAVYLDSTLNPSIQLSEHDYYKALNSVITTKRMNSFNSQLLSYILECKIKDVPDVSMRSFVGTKYPAAYRPQKTYSQQEQKGKQKKYR